MKLKIEKKIPVPTARGNDGIIEIMLKMKVNDSVMFPGELWKKARNRAYRLVPKTFTFRKVEGGYRCWRLS